jgi:hypothetical protein
LLTFDDTEFQYKISSVARVAEILITVLRQVTFGVRDVEFMRVESEIRLTAVRVRVRPRDSLRRRALMMLIYYDVEPSHARTLDYVDKWTRKPAHTFVFGPSFHPGSAAAAFGHAVAWESAVDTVAFQHFIPSRFARLLNAVFMHAASITRMGFIDYPEKHRPKLELEQVTATCISRFWFLRCCPKMILDFLEGSKHLSFMEELVLRDIAMDGSEISHMVTVFEHSPGLKKLNAMVLAKIDAKGFPYRDFAGFLSLATGLQFLSLRSLPIDGSHVLAALSLADCNIQVLKLTHLQYRTPIDPRVALPKQLVHFDVSMSAFSHDSFKSLFTLLGCGNIAVPLVFQARAIVIKPSFYADLAGLDFDAMKPNLCEFDWSMNKLPAIDTARYLFAFLFTQKQLRLLTMNDVGLEAPMDFLTSVTQLINALPLPGLDLSSTDIPSDVLQMFLQALGAMPHLRRLGVPNSNGGDAGIEMLTEALANLPDLNELVADGFRCTTVEKLAAFWGAVAAHEGVVACDVPVDDFRFLGLEEDTLDANFRDILEAVREKARPSTLDQRVRLTRDYLNRHESLDAGGDIFLKTSTMGWDFVEDQLGDFDLVSE